MTSPETDAPTSSGIHKGVLYLVPNTSSATLGSWVYQRRVDSTYDALLGGAADLNGDSAGDVVVRSRNGGGLSIITGRTDAKLGPVLGQFSGAAGLKNLSSAQMTGSAQPDVVGTNAGGTRLYVVPSNGRTNAAAPLATNLSASDATQVLSVGDWDRDGKGDVVTRQVGGDKLVLRRGLGNGRFRKGQSMGTGWASFTNLAAVGDVTGDKRPDLVGKTRTGKMTIFPGDGTRGFLAPALAPDSLQTFNQIGSGAWKPGSMPGSAFVASDGGFVPYVGTNGGDPGSYDWVIGPGDVDGDGVADLVVRDGAGTLWVLPGTTTGYGAARFLASGFSGYSLGG